MTENAHDMEAFEEEYWEEFWSRYESADFDGRLAMFYEVMDAGQMDGEAAFEMLNEMLEAAQDSQDMMRFQKALIDLRQRYPDIYEEELSYITDWQILSAVVLSQPETVRSLVPDLVKSVTHNIDIFEHIYQRLMFYGFLDEIITVLREAWPDVRHSPNIVEWGVEEFRMRGITLEILRYAAEAETPSVHDPLLRERILYFSDPEELAQNEERLMQFFAYFRGEKDIPWDIRTLKRSEARDFLDVALPVWEGVLWRSGRYPLTRIRQARDELQDYLEHALKGGRKSRGKKKKKRGVSAQMGVYLVVPTKNSLDRYWGEQLGTLFSTAHYPVAAMVHLLPEWLHFLETLGGLSSEESNNVRDSLRSLASLAIDHIERFTKDMRVREEVFTTWS